MPESIFLESSKPGPLGEAFSKGTSPFEICLMSPGEEETVDRFVKQCPFGTFFHLSAWKRIVEKLLNRPCSWLTARSGGAIRGVFPISHTRSRLFGDSLVSLPLAVYGGVCADDESAYFGLLDAGKGMAKGLGVKYLEMRNRTEPFATRLPGRDLFVTFTQDLTAGPEQLLRKLPRDTRYAIRKGQKAGLAWVEDLKDEEFYEIYAQNVHRLGTPVFPRELFRMLRQEFATTCRLFGVRKGKKAIAGVLCFYFRDEVIPYYGGSIAEAQKESANNFMYWSLIEQSCREGYRSFDFGRSKKGAGSFHFKSAWSMQMTELPYRYELVRATEVPHLSTADAKLQLPIALWKRLPYACTKIIGPRLIRLVPSI